MNNEINSTKMIELIDNEIDILLSKWRREGREKEAEEIGKHARFIFLIGLDCFALGYNHGLNVNYKEDE